MSSNQTPVVFTGKASEYFGIWIVNLLLSIVTLGIYSAWAKVRRKKYFYNNTLVDGVGFDYHASPIAILKGRIIAVVLFVLYQVLMKFSPTVAGILMLTFLVALPWIVVRGMTFNARNSSYRGLRFDFDGKYGQAALAFIGYPLLAVVTLGLAIPFVAQRINKFVFDHHQFGLSHFQMDAMVKDFYKIYLKFLGTLIAIVLLLVFAIGSLAPKHKPEQTSFNQQQQVEHSAANSQSGGFVKVANADYATEDFPQEDGLNALSPEERAEFEAQMQEYEAMMQQTEAMENNNAQTREDPVKKMLGTYIASMGALAYILMLGILLLYVAVIFSIGAYFKSRISNLIWNNTTLEHIGFSSNQRMRDLVWLYVSNALLLMLTLGLATPWAQVRMIRYRTEHLAVTGETEWDRFVGEKKASTRATGEEIADIFDVDLSFG